jgi:hypothetical protein
VSLSGCLSRSGVHAPQVPPRAKTVHLPDRATRGRTTDRPAPPGTAGTAGTAKQSRPSGNSHEPIIAGCAESVKLHEPQTIESWVRIEGRYSSPGRRKRDFRYLMSRALHGMSPI